MRFLLLILFLPSLCFSAGIGTVIGIFGTVSAVRNGVETALERGSAVYENDKVMTLANSFAKIRFTDGSLVSLIPESEYIIEKYKYEMNGSDNNYISNLIKGGLRCISGEIAKTNPYNYEFRTPTANMGVRGTIFQILIKCVGAACTTYFGCDSGRIAITNQSGESEIGPGLKYRYAEYSSQTAPPILRANPPAEMKAATFLTPSMNKC